MKAILVSMLLSAQVLPAGTRPDLPPPAPPAAVAQGRCIQAFENVGLFDILVHFELDGLSKMDDVVALSAADRDRFLKFAREEFESRRLPILKALVGQKCGELTDAESVRLLEVSVFRPIRDRFRSRIDPSVRFTDNLTPEEEAEMARIHQEPWIMETLGDVNWDAKGPVLYEAVLAAETRLYERNGTK